MDEITAALATQLRAERAAAHLTVEELANRIGVHPQAMLRYLNGEVCGPPIHPDEVDALEVDGERPNVPDMPDLDERRR